MNLLVILMCCILLIFTVRGYQKGIMKQGVFLLFWLFSFGLVGKLTPYVRDFIEHKTNIEEFIFKFLEKKMPLNLEVNEIRQITRLDKGNFLTNFFLSKNIPETYTSLGLEGVRSYIYEMMTKQILSAVIFIITLALVIFLVRSFIFSLDLMDKLPVIHQFNHIGGAFIGLAQGLLICLLLFLVVIILQGTQLGQYLLRGMEKYYIIERIYQGILMFLSY